MGIDQVHVPTFLYTVLAVIAALLIVSFLRKVF